MPQTPPISLFLKENQERCYVTHDATIQVHFQVQERLRQLQLVYADILMATGASLKEH